ncbi:MAG: radical SAM protein [Desulfobacteraceae bacterium]|nr:radical SAM protein [Desulfobacteraceae bacterium]
MQCVFTRCNLQCCYCQNFQISRNSEAIIEYPLDLNHLIDKIIRILEKGCNTVGFVSPSHVIPQMKTIVSGLHDRGTHPIIVMNTNAYDRVETLKELEGWVDVYLPDFKYADALLGQEYSDAADYPDIAVRAIREMYRQKGSMLYVNEQGIATSGLIIRHLVLPGSVENSIAVLRRIAEEISTSVHISLMSQYYPTEPVKDHPLLGRRLFAEEYKAVVEEMQRLGFYRGWIQEMDSSQHYQPDFAEAHPFETDK